MAPAGMPHELGFAFNFGVVLAMAVIILAITTCADHFPNPKHNSAAPIATWWLYFGTVAPDQFRAND